MAEIKSSWEIALERTKEVEGNPEAVEADKYQKQGKMLVSKFLGDSSFDLKGNLKSFSGKTLNWVKDGMLQVLLANLVLPQEQLALTKIKRVGEAFYVFIRNTKMLTKMFSQLESFFEEYLAEKERYREAVEKHYAPRLKQKEEELSKKMGQPIHIDINADPEFAATLRKTMASLEEKYATVLGQVKDDLIAIRKDEK